MRMRVTTIWVALGVVLLGGVGSQGGEALTVGTLVVSNSVGINVESPVASLDVVGDCLIDGTASIRQSKLSELASLTGLDACGVAVDGNKAYVAAGSGGLVIIDVSTPWAPRVLGTEDCGGIVRSVCLSGRRLVVGLESEVQLYDVGSSRNPVLLDSASLRWESVSEPGYPGDPAPVPHSLAVSGPFLYVADSGSLSYFRIADDSLVKIGSDSLGVMDVVTSGGRVLSTAYSGYFFSAPHADDGTPLYGESGLHHSVNVRAIALQRESVVLSAYDSTLRQNVITWITERPSGAERFSYKVRSVLPLQTRGQGLAVAGDFVLCGGDGGVVFLVDASDRDEPLLADQVDVGGVPRDIAGQGNLAFVASANGFTVLAISGLDAPSARIGQLLADTLQVSDRLRAAEASVSGGLRVDGGAAFGAAVECSGSLRAGDIVLRGDLLDGTGRTLVSAGNAPGNLLLGGDAGRGSTGQTLTLVGRGAGDGCQGDSITALGSYAAYGNQAANVTALGVSAGGNNSGAWSTFVGQWAGYANQGRDCVAVGVQAGAHNTTNYLTAVGSYAGSGNRGAGGAVFGYMSGYAGRGNGSSFFGSLSGLGNQGDDSTAVGHKAGFWNHSKGLVAVGVQAGMENSGTNCILIGTDAGAGNTANNVTAIGHGLGRSSDPLVDNSCNLAGDLYLHRTDFEGNAPYGDLNSGRQIHFSGGAVLTAGDNGFEIDRGLKLSGTGDMGNNRMTQVADPVEPQDAVNKRYLEQAVLAMMQNVGPFGDLSMGSFTVAPPTN